MSFIFMVNANKARLTLTLPVLKYGIVSRPPLTCSADMTEVRLYKSDIDSNSRRVVFKTITLTISSYRDSLIQQPYYGENLKDIRNSSVLQFLWVSITNSCCIHFCHGTLLFNFRFFPSTPTDEEGSIQQIMFCKHYRYRLFVLQN